MLLAMFCASITTFVLGWSELGRQRSPAIPEHICSASSSSLKFAWKMLASSGNRSSITLLDMAEVTKESNDGQWSASTLLLTSEAVFIVSAEEDAQVGGIEFRKVTQCFYLNIKRSPFHLQQE